MRRRLLIACACVLGFAPRVSAQSELARAERAYLDVDFEETSEHAHEALIEGGHTPTEVVRIYQLLGISRSALGDEAGARAAFVQMLGIDRDAALDDSVSPRLRPPYLEARGVWDARSGRLEVQVGLDRRGSALRVELRDPGEMAHRVRVASRIDGHRRFATDERPAAAILSVPIDRGPDVNLIEYYVDVLDEYGNVIYSDGTAFVPHALRQDLIGPGSGEEQGRSIFEEPAFWIVAAALAVAAGAIVTGVAVDQTGHAGIRTTVHIGLE